MALHVKLLDLNNEFLLGSHMPNRIARSAIPQHLHLHFASEGSFIQVGGLHADSPDDLVRAPFSCRRYSLLSSRWRRCRASDHELSLEAFQQDGASFC